MHEKKFSIDFLGVGTAKAGTTWFYECLSEHPDVCVSKVKEIDFFNDLQMFWRKDLFGTSNYGKGLSWYESHFKHCAPHKKIGEVSPIYFFDPEAPKRIHEHFPHAKLIIALRNPVDRLLSHYLYTKEKRFYPVPATFEEIVTSEPAFIDQGNYFKYLERYLALFPRENILVVLMEDIRNKPEETIKKIYSHIGVDPTFIPASLKKEINARDTKYIHRVLSPTVRRFESNSFGRALLSIGRGLHLNTLSKNILGLLYKEKQKKITINPKVRARLFAMYHKDIHKLAEFLGRDLSHWK
jgi:hypothetical protein